MKKLILLFVAVASLTACNDNPMEKPWVEYTSSDLGFSISLPANWVMTPQEGLEMFHPQQELDINKQGTVNVGAMEVGIALPVKSFAEMSAESIKQEKGMDVTEISQSTSKLNGQEAEVLEYTMTTEDLTQRLKQYYMVKGTKYYVVTVALMEDSKNGGFSLTDSIASTFKILDTTPAE